MKPPLKTGKPAAAVGLMFCLQLLLGISVFGQVATPAVDWAESGRPFIRNFSAKEYGGFIQNWAILQDSRGMIYVANNHGLLEHDGVGWRLYEDEGTLSAIRSLAVDSSGTIYVGTGTDFGFLRRDSTTGMTMVSLLDRVDSVYHEFNDVWSTLVLDDDVYFMAPQYLFRWTGEQVDVLRPRTGFHTAFVVAEDLYVRQWDIGLTKLTGDSLVLIPGGEAFADKRIYFMHARQDGLLIGTGEHGFFLHDGTAATYFPNSSPGLLAESKLYCGIPLEGGYYALGTRRGGLIIMDASGSIVQRISTANGLNDDSVWFVHSDEQGGLWLALNNGIARVETPAPFTVLGKGHGLNGTAERVWRHRGTLYVATSVGIQYLDIDRADGIPSAELKPVSGIEEYSWTFLSTGGQLLAGSTMGVHLIEGSSSREIPGPWSSVFALVKSRQRPDLLYIGHRNGIDVLIEQAGLWTAYAKIPDLAEKVYHIVEEPPGVLWLLTDKVGVLRVRPGNLAGPPDDINAEIVHLDTSSGLPGGITLPIIVGGEIRFANPEGLWRFDADREQFVPDSALDPSVRWDFLGVEDSQGRLWGSRSTGAGNPVDIGFSVPDAEGGFIWHPGAFRRLQDVSYVNHIYPERDGVVWFSTSEGLIRYTPELAANARRSYECFIRRVVINEDSVVFRDYGAAARPALRHDENSIRFEFAAPVFTAASHTHYQSRLLGFRDEWSNWGTETRKDFTNLFEGEYVFEARARDIYGAISSEARFVFAISPPWYRTLWAYAGLFVLLVGLMMVVDRVRRSSLIRRERERAQLREAKLRAEAAELRTEKAELLANHMQVEAERRERELERARDLQLSMLPESVPDLPNVEIATYMKTANEVGGDYYDFFLIDDATTIVVLADATGHGLDAGMMVAATKSLLQTVVHEVRLSTIINKTNRVLKNMRVRGFYMGMQLIRLAGHEVSCSVAGMPPVLVYRDATKTVEAVTMKTPPLGAFAQFDYEERALAVSPGDVMLLMSDGFPERFNGEREILGYHKATSVLIQSAQQTATEIIENFVDVGNAWADDFPQNDDITFVVLKFK